MTDPTTTSPNSSDELPPPSGWVGWIFFGGAILVLAGVFQAIAGLAALFKDDYFLVRSRGLLVHVDYTTWGWVHLVLGVVMVLAGYSLFVGRTWARVVAVVLALLSAVVNLGFLSAYPIWGTILIALDVVVIYAVTVHGAEVRRDWRG